MVRFLYSFGVFAYNAILAIVALFNNKASKLVNGRVHSKTQLAQHAFDGDWIWIHVASLGEFEQVVPIIQKIKEETSIRIAVSFYSPSGYEKRKGHKLIDFAFYFLGDSTRNAKFCIQQLKPKAILFVKYELWFNHLHVFRKAAIPFALISGRFRANQFFLRFKNSFFIEAIQAFEFLSVQNEDSKQVLEKIGVQVIVTGDSRFDRCLELTQQPFDNEKINAFVQNEKVLVFGSIWPEDFKSVKEIIELNNASKAIFAPHEVDKSSVKKLFNEFSKLGATAVYTQSSSSEISTCKFLILDTIGLLALTYRFAKVAYVGGAYKTGLHNILEPAAYGIPVLFGPKISKFPEALQMVSHGSGAVYGSTQINCDLLFNNENYYSTIAELQKQFIQQNTGASTVIFKQILPFLLRK